MVVQAGSTDQAATADREGAAPAVMGRAAAALLDAASIPWDSGLNERAREHMERMEGEGQRVMPPPPETSTQPGSIQPTTCSAT